MAESRVSTLVDELAALKAAWVAVLHHDRFKLPNGRYDTKQCRRDVESGLTPLPVDFFERLKEIARGPGISHKFAAKGIELVPTGSPTGLNQVQPEMGGGLDGAVAMSRNTDLPIVSKDCYGRLNSSQRSLLAKTDGIHQYSVHSEDIVGDHDFPGQRSEGDADSIKTEVEEGIVLVHHLSERSIVLDLHDNSPPTTIQAKWLERGVEFDTKIHVKDSAVDFDSVNQMGDCAWNMEGTIGHLLCTEGVATFRTTDGLVWTGKTHFEIEAAFRKVGHQLYLLFVRKFKKNDILFKKSVHDFFRKKIRFVIKAKKKSFYSVDDSIACNFQRNGICVWGEDGISVFERFPRVFLSKKIANRLQKKKAGLPQFHFRNDGTNRLRIRPVMQEDGQILPGEKQTLGSKVYIHLVCPTPPNLMDVEELGNKYLVPVMLNGKIKQAYKNKAADNVDFIRAKAFDATFQSVQNFHAIKRCLGGHEDCPICQLLLV